MSVSSGDYPGVITVSGNDADTSPPGISYEQLQELIQQNIDPVDITQSEQLLAGMSDKLTIIVLFCVVVFVYTICRTVYKFFNGLFG